MQPYQVKDKEIEYKKFDMRKINLSSPHLTGEELCNITDAFYEKKTEDTIKDFESRLKTYLDDSEKHVVALSSGTAAIHLGLILLGVKPGDEVICQSLTFVASANPIRYIGAKPIFVDSEKETLNISPFYLEKAIRHRINNGIKPKAIIAVNLFGMPYKYQEIRAIADRYEIPILEDASEALGSKYYEKKCGTLGDISTLSFNKNKIITTFGGGALVCNSQELKNHTIFLANQAKDKAPHYQHSQIGYNYRLNDISAYFGIEQLKVLDNRIKQRAAVNSFYKDLFNSFDEIKLLQEFDENISSNHWLSVIFLKDNNQREKLRQSLANNNIESRPVWKPMHTQPLYKDAMYFGEDTSNKAFIRGLCLPSGSNLNDEDRNRIKNCILHALK